MYFLNESFWFAICFLIFVYFAYKPLKAALLLSLNQKIDLIKSQILEAQLLKQDAEKLLHEAEQQLASLPLLQEQMIFEARNSAQAFFNERQKTIDSLLDVQKAQALSSIANQYNETYARLQNELMTDTLKLVVEYFKESHNESLSDVQIAKNLNLNKI